MNSLYWFLCDDTTITNGAQTQYKTNKKQTRKKQETANDCMNHMHTGIPGCEWSNPSWPDHQNRSRAMCEHGRWAAVHTPNEPRVLAQLNPSPCQKLNFEITKINHKSSIAYSAWKPVICFGKATYIFQKWWIQIQPDIDTGQLGNKLDHDLSSRKTHGNFTFRIIWTIYPLQS